MTAAGSGMLGVTYATATADAVAAFVAAHYDLQGPVECVLLQRGFNDSFAIRTQDQTRFVLRMSGRRKRGDADVDAETRFLAYLDSVGVLVSAAVPNRTGSLFCEAVMPEGRRPVVLFRHAEGRAPDLDAPEDARAQGVTLARLHDAAERFPDREAGRYRLDLDHLLHRPLANVLALTGHQGRNPALFFRTGIAAGCIGPRAAGTELDSLSRRLPRRQRAHHH